MCGPYGYPMWGGGWIMMILVALFGFLLLAGLVVLVIWLASRYSAPGGGRENALDILNRRYASGEISREEYERMKRELAER